MNLCPSCKSDDPARAGSRYQCMDCGRVLGSRRRPRGERPDARQLTIQSIADGKRFRGRAPLGMLSVPIVSRVVLGVVAATIATEAPLSTTVTTVFAVLSALAVMWFVLILAHYSEIDVTPAAIEIRSFPFGGRSAGTYPRQRVVAFG